MKLKLYLFRLALFTQLSFFGQTLDQSNAPSNPSGGGFQIANSGIQNVGQSFTAGITGRLSQVNVYLNNSSFVAGNFMLTVYNGFGYGGSVVGVEYFSMSTYPGNGEYIINISNSIQITSGNVYTLRFDGLSGSVNMFATQDIFSGGVLYYGSSSPYPAYDLWFKTFVTLPSPATHLNFDGVNDDIVLPTNIGNTLSNGTELTIEYWFKGTNVQSAVRIQNGVDYIVAGWGASNNPQFLVSTDGGTSGVFCGPSVADNSWHHLAFVWKRGTTFATYVDGVLVNSRVAANVNLPVFSGITGRIGSFNSGSEYMNGNIDEVRIWNVAKTPAQINASKNCELQGNETGLLAYYKFNQGIDSANNVGVTTLTDATSNANNGTLSSNFALAGATSNWLAGSPVLVPSTATVITPVIYNQGDTASVLTATVGANGTGLLWYTTATGGVGSPTAPTPSTASTGSTSYWVSSTNANGCESARTEIVVTVNAVIQNAPTTLFTTQVYTGDDKDLTTLQVTGSNIKWYNVATGGSPLANSTLLVDETTYYASQTVNGSESTNRLAVTVNRISNNTQMLPANSTVANLVATPSIGTTAQWFSVTTGGTALGGTDVLTNGTYYLEQFSPAGTETLGSGFSNPSGVAVQSDGKIIIADTYNNAIKRMNTDGSNIEILGSGFNWPYAVSIQADGKIVIADYGNHAIKRMDADGSNIVTLGSGFLNPNDVAVQADGKIVIADYGNRAVKRMDADGSNIVTLASGVNCIAVAIQPNGKIILSDSYAINAVKRMDADGSNVVALGSGFDSPTGIAIQPDGKIIITDFWNPSIKRMDADGSNIVTLASGFQTPKRVALQTDGKIIIVDGMANAIKRITLASSSNRVPVIIDVTTLSSENFENNEIAVYPNPTDGVFIIKTDKAVQVKVHDMLGRLVVFENITTTQALSIENQATGIYIVTITSENGAVNSIKLIKQ